ncbi:hypothetical protein [Actinoplanes philippinensis]|uniref:hypothetical protein n=1 Tax=Actinoplanes philippinensis TaxID=35752 RepID=UPI00340F1D73
MIARSVAVGMTATCVLLASGCSSDDSPDVARSQSASTTPSATVLTPAAAAERDALTAYRGMWATFVEAGRTSDPEYPDLRTYASGQALRLIASSLFTDRDQRKVTKGDLVLNPKVSVAKPTTAPTEVEIVDCVDSTKWLKYKASGGLWDDKPGGKHRNTATVKSTDGVWKVDSFILEGAGTC